MQKHNDERMTAAAVLTMLAALASLAPSAHAQAPGQASAVIELECDRDCLIGFTERYLDALEHRDVTRAPFAPHVRFTENNVEMPLGNDGLWGTINAVWEDSMAIADEETGNAAWFGIVEEHGNPAYLALRLRIESGRITEAETIVNRLPDMPKPFGDPTTLYYDPAFAEVVPAEDRRSRERLVAIADGYFSTVELNDGTIFTPFHEDCGRVENGIRTTSGGSGENNAAAIAQGCEEQLELGIYRINKRIRERRYPLVDVERQVVVATGFFDHANTFDRYTLTDGREMRTVLKWPNSISLIEAFKIKDGKIHRIHAVFTYVPYFMHSPFARPNLDWQTR